MSVLLFTTLETMRAREMFRKTERRTVGRLLALGAETHVLLPLAAKGTTDGRRDCCLFALT
jgi:hypothetical protein